MPDHQIFHHFPTWFISHTECTKESHEILMTWKIELYRKYKGFPNKHYSELCHTGTLSRNWGKAIWTRGMIRMLVSNDRLFASKIHIKYVFFSFIGANKYGLHYNFLLSIICTFDEYLKVRRYQLVLEFTVFRCLRSLLIPKLWVLFLSSNSFN